MMFTVFAEKDIFEDILIDNIKTPNWFSIFCNHSDICLNITDIELDFELSIDSPISYFYRITGGKEPKALSGFFQDIYADKSMISECPRSVFFLNYPKVEADLLQSNYGVIVQSREAIIDNVLTGSFKRKLFKDEVIEEGLDIGWKHLLRFNFPPSNSIVISDNYLLPSTERIGIKNVNLGKSNLIKLLDVILPQNLLIPFHILIISEHGNRDEIWRQNLATELDKGIKLLRNYNIVVEIVYIKSEDLHERLLLMNYLNSTCEHGFCVFKAKDDKTVSMVNKLQINSYYSSLENSQGDSEFQLAVKDLSLIKSVCNQLTTHIQNGNPFDKGSILGDCNPDKTIVNRLINDV